MPQSLLYLSPAVCRHLPSCSMCTVLYHPNHNSLGYAHLTDEHPRLRNKVILTEGDIVRIGTHIFLTPDCDLIVLMLHR